MELNKKGPFFRALIAMAPDFWDPCTLGTIKKFLPEDKSGIILYNHCKSLLDDTQSRAVEDKF